MRRKLLTSVKRFRAARGAGNANRRRRSERLRIGVLLITATALPTCLAGQQDSATQVGEASTVSALGQTIFRAQCSACHGLDGRGGEHAPSIVQDQIKSLSDADLARTVHNGIPAKGMPEFSSLGSPAIKSVVAYLRKLQGTVAPEAVTGDATRGRALFFGKAGCSACHVMEGTGSFVADDLSDYGRDHQPSEIRGAILDARKVVDLPPEQATVTTRRGTEVSGVMRNEDNFSFQLQDARGDFYLILKSDAIRVTRAPVRRMPSDYSERLTSQEMDDVVSFIARPKPE